jgi:hypothetical protein
MKHFNPEPDLPDVIKPLVSKAQLNLGLKALDAVKHCECKMNKHQRQHDKLMRNIPPIRWTSADITQMRITERSVNQ